MISIHNYEKEMNINKYCLSAVVSPRSWSKNLIGNFVFHKDRRATWWSTCRRSTVVMSDHGERQLFYLRFFGQLSLVIIEINFLKNSTSSLPCFRHSRTIL